MATTKTLTVTQRLQREIRTLGYWLSVPEKRGRPYHASGVHDYARDTVGYYFTLRQLRKALARDIARVSHPELPKL